MPAEPLSTTNLWLTAYLLTETDADLLEVTALDFSDNVVFTVKRTEAVEEALAAYEDGTAMTNVIGIRDMVRDLKRRCAKTRRPDGDA